jgi:hypothetical protein
MTCDGDDERGWCVSVVGVVRVVCRVVCVCGNGSRVMWAHIEGSGAEV